MPVSTVRPTSVASGLVEPALAGPRPPEVDGIRQPLFDDSRVVRRSLSCRRAGQPHRQRDKQRDTRFPLPLEIGFRNGEIQDSDTENKAYAGDWVLPDYLDGFITMQLGGDGSDAFKRAQANAKGVKLPPYNPKANGIFFVEFGPGPTKYATGQYNEQLRFHAGPSPVTAAELKVGSLQIPIAPADDLGFQATTRGGRVMDHVLGRKAVFKSTTDTVGNVALIGGLATAAASDNRTAQGVGLGIAFAGLVSKAISAATVPAADIRTWSNLPRYLSFVSVPLPPGQHTATIQFLDASGRVVANLTKTITVNITTTDRDKVVFVSDTSLTPQTL